MKSKIPSIPYFIWMSVFIIVPMLMIVYYAFTNSDGAFTLSNISGTMKNDFAMTFGRSIWLAFIATIICLILAYPFAFMISRFQKHQQGIFYMLAILPMWVNFLLRTYAWMTLLENNGLINKFLGLFGLGPFQMINTPGAVVLGMVYDYIPFMILPLYSIMVKIDESVIQAAQDLGAHPLKVLTKVVIPLSLPGISTGVTMVFVPSISTFIISKMLGGNTSILIGDLIESQFTGTSYNPNVGSAISVVLMVIVFVIMTLANQFDNEDVGDMIK